jgi:hypothetical protein
MRLPRLVEADPRGPQVLRILSTHTRPLWQGSDFEVPTVELGAGLAEALRSVGGAGQVVRGLEGAEQALAAEERGLRLARGADQGIQDVRVSRLLVLADDGAERFYRHVDTLLRRHGPRVLAVRLNVDAHALGELLFAPSRLVRLVMIMHKEAVSAILLAMAGQGEGAGGGRAEREGA